MANYLRPDVRHCTKETASIQGKLLLEKKRKKHHGYENIASSGTCMLSCFSHVVFFATLWAVTLQASLSVGISRLKYLSGLSCTTPGDIPNPGVKICISYVSCIAGRFFTPSVTWEVLHLKVPGWKVIR